jgi:hypothetical protein
MVRFAVVRQHGAPEGLVNDEGSIFRAKHLLTVRDRFGVVKHEIARRQAWQNSIEANFGIQRRLADWGFGRAGSWPEPNGYSEARGRFIGWLNKNAYEDGSNPFD